MPTLNDIASKASPANLIAHSLVLTAGLAWNSVIQRTMTAYMPLNDKRDLKSRWIYTAMLTVIIIILISAVSWAHTKAVQFEIPFISGGPSKSSTTQPIEQRKIETSGLNICGNCNLALAHTQT